MSFPVINANTVIVNKDGTPTQAYIRYLSTLSTQLNTQFADDGHVVRTVDEKTIEQLEADNTKNKLTKLVHNTSTQKYMMLNPKTNKFENIKLELP